MKKRIISISFVVFISFYSTLTSANYTGGTNKHILKTHKEIHIADKKEKKYTKKKLKKATKKDLKQEIKRRKKYHKTLLQKYNTSFKTKDLQNIQHNSERLSKLRSLLSEFSS